MIATRSELGRAMNDLFHRMRQDAPGVAHLGDVDGAHPMPDWFDAESINLLANWGADEEKYIKREHEAREMLKPPSDPPKRFHMRLHLAIAQGIAVGIRVGLLIAEYRKEVVDGNVEPPVPELSERVSADARR